MKESIYQIATKCKQISDNLQIFMKISNNRISYSYSLNPQLFGKELQELCDSLYGKYPDIGKDLQNHIIQYDNGPLKHQGAIEAIINCVLSLEKDTSANRRKIFISHATKDAPIINAFVKEILMLGCGFSSNDIFCTLDHTTIRTGDDFSAKIVEGMKGCNFILCMISDNYQKSEICQNELGAAWALEDKRMLPFKFPNVKFIETGFLNVVKQGADITDNSKLDELYTELCDYYGLHQDWINFNQRKIDFIKVVNESIDS